MPRVEQTAKLNLTSYSGLALIGQCFDAAQVGMATDSRLPVSQGMKASDMVKAMTGLLSLGKSDFAAIEPFRTDRFFKEALGKRVGLLDLQLECAWRKHKRTFRMIVEVTERTFDKKGQHLLVPDIQLAGWWTSLTLPAEEVIEHYRYHSTHEQFHSEIKSDLDLERLPSGKFDTNDAILHLGAFAYNCLRLIGQWGLTGEIAPILHPAKRRRLKSVLQEIMYRAAKFVVHARKLALDCGRNFADHVKVFVALQDRLQQAASP